MRTQQTLVAFGAGYCESKACVLWRLGCVATFIVYWGTAMSPDILPYSRARECNISAEVSCRSLKLLFLFLRSEKWTAINILHEISQYGNGSIIPGNSEGGESNLIAVKSERKSKGEHQLFYCYIKNPDACFIFIELWCYNFQFVNIDFLLSLSLSL